MNRMDGIVKGIPKHSSKPIVDGIITGIKKIQHPKLEVPIESCAPGATQKSLNTFGSGLLPQGEGNLKSKGKSKK